MALIYMQFRLNKREKRITLLIKDIIYYMLGFYSQEATCHRLEQNKLQQLSVHHWGMCVPSFILLRWSHNIHCNVSYFEVFAQDICTFL